MPETCWSVDQKKSYMIVLSLKIKLKDFVCHSKNKIYITSNTAQKNAISVQCQNQLM